VFKSLFFVLLLQANSLLAEEVSCSQMALSTTEMVRSELGLRNIQLNLPKSEVCLQHERYVNMVSYRDAVNLAFESFLNDGTHIESPIALAIEISYSELGIPYQNPHPPEVLENAKKNVLGYLNDVSSQFSLVPVGQLPEHGETVQENWVFKLKMPRFSDHIYWAVIDRTGVRKVYNYGFN
jgi:hypothetical protein